MSEPVFQTDVQRVLFEHDGVAFCRFHCPPGHGRWQRENRIGDGHNLAFPENPVEIAPVRHPRIVADPNHVVFYNDGDAFRHRMLDVSGDVSNVLLFDSSHVVTALEDRDPHVRDRPKRPFRIRQSFVSPRTHLRQRLVFQRAAGGGLDPEQGVEAALAILAAVVDEAHAEPASALGSVAAERQREVVTEVRRRLARDFADAPSIRSLAEELGLSAFHLCRVFRRHTGTTIHRYLTRVRLRAALACLEDGSPDLATLALDVGFAHQSHFTEAFRREYGSPPGALRRRLERSSGPIWP